MAEVTFRQALNETLREELKRDENVFLMLGLRPIVEIMTINFIILAMDEIVNHAAKIYYMFGGQCPIPLVIRTPGGGGQQLSATHSQNLEVWFSHVPGLKVVAPSTPEDAKGLLRSSVLDNNPVIFLENLALYNVRGEVPQGYYTTPIGKAKVSLISSTRPMMH